MAECFVWVVQHLWPVPNGFDVVFCRFDVCNSDGITQICDCLLGKLAFAEFWVELMFKEGCEGLSQKGNVPKKLGAISTPNFLNVPKP